MPRENISFKTSDGVTLHGWFYPSATKLDHEGPCLVMSHGFSAIKEMGLDDYAEAFQAGLPTLSILVYDHRGLGASGTGTGQVRSEIIPAEQNSDMQDAITFAQLQPEVDPEKIGIWGSSYSGGHVLYVAAVDKRVRAVISQVSERYPRAVKMHIGMVRRSISASVLCFRAQYPVRLQQNDKVYGVRGPTH